MTAIVVSRRDGILRAPDGAKFRVARGKTLAEADHPAVIANPGDWSPMVVALTVGDRERATDGPLPEGGAARLAQAENDLVEVEETLAGRDAELTRLADGLAAAGITLPAEDEREAGWLVDLALEAVGAGLNALKEQVSPATTGFNDPQPATPVPAVAPPSRPRKRTVPPLVTRTGDDD